MKKRLYMLLLCVGLLLLLCAGTSAAEDKTYPMPTGTVAEKLNTLKGIFKEGLYWNHWSEADLGDYDQWNVTIGDFTTTLSTKPCTKHTSGDRDSCNDYWGVKGGTQCCGYARMIYHFLWNADPTTKAYALRYIPSSDDASMLDHVKVGDIVWTGSHFFLVTAINGNTFSGTDCNGLYVCNIKWSRTWKREALEDKMKDNGCGAIFSPTQTIINDSSCDWQTYQIVYSKGQNVRRQPDTRANAVKTAQKGDIVYVDMNRTVKFTSSGTWGYAKTGDGKYGWMRIDLESYCVKVDIAGITTVDSIPRIAVSTKANTGSDQCYIKDEPYEAATTVRVEPKDSIIYHSGCVKNSYGNTWYVTEDGGYIYEGDLEIKVPNATIKSESAYTAVAVSASDTCCLKDKPYSAAGHDATVSEGQTVEIIAEVVNYYGNTWYKTADGKYVYSDDVEIYDADFSIYTDINAEFSWQEEAYSRALPYSAMPKINKITLGQVVTVKRVVINDYGNLWAQLSDGNYLCFYDKESSTCYAKFWEFTSDPFVTTSGLTLPSGELPYGEDFDVSGVIKGANNCPIVLVDAFIMNPDGRSDAENSTYIRMTTPKSSIDLANGMEINENFSFSTLEPGTYTFKVRLVMGFMYDGYPFHFNDNMFTLAESQFTVVDDAADSGDITFTAGSGLTGTAGDTVTVPISINNPDAVPLGSITLAYDLPTGVTISKATLCGSAANASVAVEDRATWITSLDSGISGSGKILELTFELGTAVTLPAEFSMNFEICHATELVYANPAPVTIRIEEKTDRTPGDVNVDGKINSLDAFAVLKYSVGYNIAINTANADVNADGKINSLDAFMILKKSVGYDIELK